MTEKDYALISPEGDEHVGKQVFAILAKVVDDKVRLGLHTRWKRNHQLRRNQHWRNKSPSSVPLVSANMLYTHTQRTANTLTDNEPTFNVASVGQVEEGQEDQVGDLQRCTEHWWRDQEQQDILETSIINGEQYGVAIEKVIFNPDLEYNLGEVETVVVDPFHFGFYPVKLASMRDLQKSEAVLHYYRMPVRQLQQKYPKLAEKIKTDDTLLEELADDERREIVGEGSVKKGSTMISISNTIRELINVAGSTSDSDDETTVCEFWLRDKSTVTRETETEKTQEPKYTGEIRYILVCSGGVVLEDRDNPSINPTLAPEESVNTYLFDKFPFSAVNSLKDTSNAWGFSDYEELEALNMEVNKALSQFVHEKDISAKKKFINPKTSGVKSEDITNITTVLEPASAEHGMGWIDAPQSSVDYEKAIGLFKDFFFLVSGTFELDQAQVGGREVIAYKAIAALLERAATMMRGKIRSYSRLIRERGRMYLSHVMNFYTEERWITYKDEDGKEASKPVIGSSLNMPAKLTVVSGSTMPISRVQQREEALGLFQQGAIDQTELLDKLDWSNRSEVVKRMMAGPMGVVLQKLMTAQVPEPVMNYIKSVAEADPKDLEKALKEGQIPSFTDFMQQLMAQEQGQQEGPSPEETVAAVEVEKGKAEIQKIGAEVEKVLAERDLINEKAVTERVTQTVKLAGVDFDSETMKMGRAKLVHDMESSVVKQEHEGLKAGLDFVSKVSAQNNRPGFNEKGLSSNNQEE